MFDQFITKSPYLSIYRECRNASEHPQTRICCMLISAGCFSDDRFGYEQFVLCAFLCPPLSGDLLPSSRADHGSAGLPDG